MSALAVVAGVSLAIGGILLAWVSRHLAVFEDLAPADAAAPNDGLTVVLPACNEAATIGPAISSLLAQDLEHLQIVVVDDRSTDGTTEAARRAAAGDPRVHIVRVDTLPPGWLGKVHALEVGRRAAHHPWILFTDADVIFGPGTLRRALAAVAQRKLDHLAVIPQTESGSWLGTLAIAAFGSTFFIASGAALVGKPGSRAYAGIGAFNLVRADLLDAADGFGPIRCELADDFGLGLIVRDAGGRAAFAVSRSLVRVRWYDGFVAMMHGMEKNAFAVMCRFQPLLALLLVAALCVPAAGIAAALVARTPLALGAAGGGWAALAAGGALLAHRVGGKAWANALLPLGDVLLAAIIAWSAFVTLRLGGVRWRGTVYPADELRRAQRVRVGPVEVMADLVRVWRASRRS